MTQRLLKIRTDLKIILPKCVDGADKKPTVCDTGGAGGCAGNAVLKGGANVGALPIPIPPVVPDGNR